MKISFAIHVCIALLIMSSINVHAFGKNGHRIVAGIAEKHLSKKAKKSVMKITGDRPLAILSTWPDEIRSDPSWDHAETWHYMSIDDNETFENYKHSESGDVITSLNMFEKVLMDRSASNTELWQALAFYIHFVGDIHQPLHVGRRDDRGGNSVLVKWFDRETNLHVLWDSILIDFQELSYKEYIEFIDYPSRSDIKAWQSSDYSDWARESKSYRENVYSYGNQRSLNYPKLGYEYNFINKPIIERRMLQAGVRLAGKLNLFFK